MLQPPQLFHVYLLVVVLFVMLSAHQLCDFTIRVRWVLSGSYSVGDTTADRTESEYVPVKVLPPKFDQELP